MIPEAGRTRPAIAARRVLLPEPEGPKRTVTPAGTSTSTSRVNASARARAPRCDTVTRACSSSANVRPLAELVDAVEGGHREEAEEGDHPERVLLAVRLDGVVDGEGRGLGLAGDVAGDH